MADAKLTLKDLADKLSDDLASPKGQTYEALKTMFDSIATSASKGATVSIHGFGSFKKKVSGARTGRNPQTGEAIKISASETLGFKAVPSLKVKAKGAPKKK